MEAIKVVNTGARAMVFSIVRPASHFISRIITLSKQAFAGNRFFQHCGASGTLFCFVLGHSFIAHIAPHRLFSTKRCFCLCLSLYLVYVLYYYNYYYYYYYYYQYYYYYYYYYYYNYYYYYYYYYYYHNGCYQGTIILDWQCELLL